MLDRLRFFIIRLGEKLGLKQDKLVRDEYEEAKRIKEEVEELMRSELNPILGPNKENDWEALQTFNPGVVENEEGIHFVYRAIGHDRLSRLGYAHLEDGEKVVRRNDYHVFEHVRDDSPRFSYYSSGGSFGGSEDPRLVKIKEDERIYMTYTYVGEGLGVALSSITEEDFLNHEWNWERPVVISKPGEIHKNWVVFPEKIGGKYVILHSLSPEVSVAYRESLEFGEGKYVESQYERVRREGEWDTFIRGVGAPPLKTEEGWLIFYHAINEQEPYRYKVGAMLLDLEEPEKVLYRSTKPVLEPDMEYENNGFKAGVVYVSGAVIRKGRLYIYYGASDSYVGVATAKLDEFLQGLVNNGKRGYVD